MSTKVTIVAHRGGKSGHEENTISAFLHILEKGIKGLEMDMRLDHSSNSFYLEHDFFHAKHKRANTIDKILPRIPRDTFVMVELKTHSWLTDSYAKKFNEAFNKYFNSENTIVISFNPFILTRLRRINPSMRRGYLCGMPYWLLLFKALYAKKMQPDMFLIHKRLLNKKNVNWGRAHKMSIWAFVLNKPKEWQKALDLKVDGITTDYPVELREYLDN